METNYDLQYPCGGCYRLFHPAREDAAYCNECGNNTLHPLVPQTDPIEIVATNRLGHIGFSAAIEGKRIYGFISRQQAISLLQWFLPKEDDDN